MSVFVVFSAFPSETGAREVARTLVEEGLAARVNVLPGATSIYRWEGKLEEANETLTIMKVAPANYPALERRLRELHPYDLPEIVALETAAGLPAYLDWVVR